LATRIQRVIMKPRNSELFGAFLFLGRVAAWWRGSGWCSQPIRRVLQSAQNAVGDLSEKSHTSPQYWG
jgi:hypothetical protein